MNSTFTELWHFGGRVNVLCLELISSCALQKGCWQVLCSQRKRAKMKHELKACSSYWCNIYGLEITAYLCGMWMLGLAQIFGSGTHDVIEMLPSRWIILPLIFKTRSVSVTGHNTGCLLVATMEVISWMVAMGLLVQRRVLSCGTAAAGRQMLAISRINYVQILFFII